MKANIWKSGINWMITFIDDDNNIIGQEFESGFYDDAFERAVQRAAWWGCTDIHIEK